MLGAVGAVPGTFVSANGTYTEVLTANNNFDRIVFRTGGTAFNGSITNISVIEITTDTNLPRINYEGFSYQDALGSEEIVNGNFDDGLNGWATSGSTPATVLNGIATIPNTSYIFQNALADGKQGKIVVSGNGSVRYRLGTNLSYSGQTAMPFTVYGAFGQNARIQIQNSSGTDVTIDNVSVKEYLGQEVVPNSGCGSWLFEPQSTNLITQSETFSDASWNASTDVIIDKGYLAPDGTNNATKVTVDGATPKVAMFLTGTGPYTKSIYARTVSGTGTMYFGEGFPSGTAALSNVTEQWQRFEVTNTLSNFYAADFRGASTLTEVIIWGAQFEDNISYATSYIPTNGSQVTRNQDVCNNGGSLATINSTEGVLYAEIAGITNDGTFKVISLSDGTTSNVVRFYKNTTDNQLSIRVTSSGVNYFNQIFNLSNSNATNKVALKYKENDFAFWVNGIEVKTDNNGITPIGLNVLNFSEGNGISPFYGKTKALAVWKEALSDQELTELTTI